MAGKNLCLISTVDDPARRLLNISKILLPEIKSLYDEVVIRTTGGTNRGLVDLIGKNSTASVEAKYKDAQGIGAGRRLVIKSALSVSKCDMFHMCDYDRILWWYANYPDELAQTIKKLKSTDKFVIIGRTEKALKSHPWLQYETERIASRLFSEWYGYDVDVLSGSRGIPRKIAKDILCKSSTRGGAGIDVEWPLLVGRDNIVSFNVDGLGYESDELGIRKEKFTEIMERITNLNEAVKVIQCLT